MSENSYFTLDALGSDRYSGRIVEVTMDEYKTLVKGGSIRRHSEMLRIGDANFAPVLERKIVKRGGPGSGHHGHAGRPGKVGGSQPGRGLRYSYAPEGQYEYIGTESLEDAISNGRGQIYVTTDDGQLWGLFSYPTSDERGANREFTLDDIDFQKEIDTAVDDYDYFMALMTDPDNAKAFAAGDRGGQRMLDFTRKFLEDWEKIQANRGDYLESFVRQYSASMNIIMVLKEF